MVTSGALIFILIAATLVTATFLMSPAIENAFGQYELPVSVAIFPLDFLHGLLRFLSLYDHLICHSELSLVSDNVSSAAKNSTLQVMKNISEAESGYQWEGKVQLIHFF